MKKEEFHRKLFASRRVSCGCCAAAATETTFSLESLTAPGSPETHCPENQLKTLSVYRSSISFLDSWFSEGQMKTNCESRKEDL